MAITVAAIQATVSVTGADKAKSDLKSVSDSVNNVSDGLRSFVVGAAVAAGVAFVGIGVASTKMAGDFQQSMTKLTTTAGEQTKNIKMIGDGILDMSVQVGTGAQKLGDAMYWIESGGAHGATALTDLKIAAMGAKAENANLDDVAKALMFTLNNFGSTGLTAAGAMNTLIAGVGNGEMSMNDLSGAISNILPTAKTFGISLTDIVGALDTMTMQGDSAASAATHLAMMIKTLEAPAKAGTDALRSIGLTTQQVTDKMRVSLPDAIDMIVTAMKKKFPEGSTAYNEALKAISGGSRSMAAIMETSGTQMDTFRLNVDNINKAVKAGGNSIAGWSDIQQNFNFKVDQARAVVEQLGIKIGTALLPKVGELLAQIIPMVISFGNWIIKSGLMENAANLLVAALKRVSDTASGITAFFQKNQGAMDNMKIGVIALAGVIGGILVASVVSATISFWALNIAALPWIALAAAIGAAVALLVVGFIYLYNSSKPVRDFMVSLGAAFGFLTPVFNQIWKDISGLVVPAWNDLAKAFQSAMPEITMIGRLLLGLALVIVGVVIAAVVALVVGVVAMSGGIIRVFTGIIEFIKGFCDIFGGLWYALLDVLTGHTDEAIGHLQMAWSGVLLMFKGVWDAIVGVFMAAVGLVGGIIVGFVRTIVGYFQGLYDNLVGHSIIPDMVNAIVSWFAQLPGRVGTWVVNMYNTVVDWFSKLPGRIMGFMDTIKTNIGDAWNWIYTTITNKAGDIFNNIMKPFNQARDAIGGVIKSFVDNSIAVFNQGITGIENFVNLMGTGINDIANALGAGNPVPHFSLGRIPAYATGTDSHPGGPAIVGEKGREMVWMPKGSKVAPNDVTEQILAGGKVPGYAGGIGDIAGSILGWIGGGAKGILDGVMNAMNIHLTLPGQLSGLATGMIGKVKDWAVSFIDKILPKFGGLGPDGKPVNIPGNLQSWITQAMALAGAPATWGNDLGIIAMKESGGNPNAINLTDSNAQAGHPSQGIMQTIPSTFAAYALPGHGNILNPVDNIIAGIRYIMSRYGDVFHVPGIVSMANGGSYIGYANGTNYAQGGMAMVGERGPEFMFVPRGSQITPNSALSTLQGGTVVHIHNYIDGKEITDNTANRIVKSSRGIGPIRSNS